jgi:hypothetical protein
MGSYYWVYYRLSKTTYNTIKKRKLERAKVLAYDFYQKAEGLKTTGEVANALSFYMRAFSGLKNYLDEDLSVETENNEIILLGNEIIKGIGAIYSNITLRLNEEKLMALVGKPMDTVFKLNTLYRANDGSTVAIDRLPLRYYFSKGSGLVQERSITNTEGWTSFSVLRLTGNESYQEITAEVDVNSMIDGDDKPTEMAKMMLQLIDNKPTARLRIEAKPILAYFEASEMEFETSSEREAISNEVKKYFSNRSFAFTTSVETADVIIKLDARAVKGGYNELHRLHTVFIDCYLSILNAHNGNKIYYKGFDQVRGQQVGSWENGLKEAQLNTLQRIREEVLPEIHNLNF